jgi:D-lactate dehydrogenase (cytochrome)
LALQGGVCIDLSRMNRILQISVDDLDCRVEAGATRLQLERKLGREGLFFPVDPGADATLGGMAATGASGTTTVRYGTMKENVLGLTVVLADGGVIRTGGRARKSSSGYDLTRLFVGSEGTLGIITELQLRLQGIPEAISAAVCQYPDLHAAVDTAIAAIQVGIPVARVELLDENQMRASIAYSGLSGYQERPTLFFEFHGSAAGVEEQARAVREISDEHGGSRFAWSKLPEERSRLWKARHDAYFAGLELAPGKKAITTDVCVPISKLADSILAAKADVEASGLTVTIVGHVGDGNFHLLILVDPDDPDEIARGKALNARLVERALAVGGTCTGEHGIGYGKIGFMEAEHGDAVKTMWTIKRALDPDNILNPGKVLPSTRTGTPIPDR